MRVKIAFQLCTSGAVSRMVDPKDAKAIMEDVKVYLKNGTVYNHFVSASIIDGTTEAVSGWIAVNYLTRNVRRLCAIIGTSLGITVAVSPSLFPTDKCWTDKAKPYSWFSGLWGSLSRNSFFTSSSS